METTSMMVFAIKSIAITLIIWLAWYLFLRNVNKFSWVRMFLLGGVILSIALPKVLPILNFTNLVNIGGIPLSANLTLPALVITPEENTFSWLKVILIIYYSISLFFIFKLTIQIYKLLKLIKEGKRIEHNGIYIIEHERQISPFSFMNYCFINHSLIPEEKLEGVIIHEKAHFQKLHSLDIIIFEIIGIFMWFNPFYWMLRKALVEVHEYQADKDAINSKTDPYAYLDAIVSIAFNGIALPLGNNFNKSLTLKRLAMISITKPSKGAVANIAIALLFSFPLVFAISCDSSNEALPVTEEIAVTKSNPVEAKTSSEGEVFVVVEEMPLFEGQKSEKFREYIVENLSYPMDAQEKRIQGKVFVSFIVETDGTVTNVKVVRGVDPSLDNEAIRVVESSPKWTPGKQRGQAVRTSFTFPIIFRLQ